MWYPPQHQQQQQYWNGYVHHLSPQQQQQHQKQSYVKTSYYCNTDESLNRNQTTAHAVGRNNANEPLVHYQRTDVDNIYVTGVDYYVTSSSGSYTDEMSSSSSIHCQASTTHWNPVITAPTKASILSNNPHSNDPQMIKPSSSSSSCWDWLLYPPEIYSHLYVPSSSFIQQEEDDELDLIASLPTWLLVLLYPSMKEIHSTNEENDSDQEISSLNNNNHHHNEPSLSMNIDQKITRVSSENPPPSTQPSQQNRSSTPDTDDGYQSASDASRSDYSQLSSLPYDHHISKDDITAHVPSSLMPKRISYAAAVKPMSTLINHQKLSPSSTSIIRTKNHSSASNTNDLVNMNGQKSKFFIAPRFERMHHAKQYSPSTATTTSKDSSSSTSSFPSTTSVNRAGIRSNNNYNHDQRNHIIHSSRRR